MGLVHDGDRGLGLGKLLPKPNRGAGLWTRFAPFFDAWRASKPVPGWLAEAFHSKSPMFCGWLPADASKILDIVV